MSPKISICIPTYNGADYIQETFESILAQDTRDFEVVISDDNSQDDTLELAYDFKRKVSFPVKVYKHSPSGIGANWNHTISKSVGTYVKLLFQDDILLPGCLNLLSRFLDDHPKYGMVSSKREFIIEEEMKGPDVDHWLALFGDLQREFKDAHEPYLHLDKSIFGLKTFFTTPLNKIGEPSVYMFRRSIYNRIGPFREDLKQILDYEFCYRTLRVSDIAVLPETLVAFRIHPHQATNMNLLEDIPDYRLYEFILYDEYRKWLHPILRKKLTHKFSAFHIYKDKLSLFLKLTYKKWFG